MSEKEEKVKSSMAKPNYVLSLKKKIDFFNSIDSAFIFVFQ